MSTQEHSDDGTERVESEMVIYQNDFVVVHKEEAEFEGQVIGQIELPDETAALVQVYVDGNPLPEFIPAHTEELELHPDGRLTTDDDEHDDEHGGWFR